MDTPKPLFPLCIFRWEFNSLKALAYSIALVVLAAVGLNLSSSRAQLYEIHRGGVTRHVGYVDMNKLVALHPESKALAIMQATLADVRRASLKSAAAHADSPGAIRGSAAKAKSIDDRKALEAEVAWLAVKREADLESDQQQAIQARQRSSREEMTRSAESEISGQVRDIQDAAAAKLRSSAERYGPNRLNAQMKLSAVTSSSKSAGVDPTLAAAKVKDAQAALDTINQASAREADAIKAEAQKQIDALHKSASAKVEQALAIYASGQTDRIKRGAKTARDETISELYPSQMCPRVDEAAGKLVSVPASAHAAYSSALNAEVLQKRIAALEAQIRADLSRAIDKLARQKGVAVTFARRSGSVPDDTHVYYELLRDHPLLTEIVNSRS